MGDNSFRLAYIGMGVRSRIRFRGHLHWVRYGVVIRMAANTSLPLTAASTSPLPVEAVPVSHITRHA